MSEPIYLITETALTAHREITSVLVEGANAGRNRFETGEMTADEIVHHVAEHVRSIRHALDCKKPVSREDITHGMTRLAMLLAVNDAAWGALPR